MSGNELLTEVAEGLALDFFVRCLKLPDEVTTISEAKKEAKDILAKVKQHYKQEFNNALEADAHNWDTRELDRPELREKISGVLHQYIIRNLYETITINEGLITDQILARIPDIEETEAYFRGRRDGLTILEANVAEAKKQERERIGGWLENELYQAELNLPIEDLTLLMGIVSRLKCGQALEDEI